MIELYTWGTPNGRKVSIMLEECGLPYNTHKINIGTNTEQFTADYLKINPNGKIPSIVDTDGPDGAPIWLEDVFTDRRAAELAEAMRSATEPG